MLPGLGQLERLEFSVLRTKIFPAQMVSLHAALGTYQAQSKSTVFTQIVLHPLSDT